MGELKKTFIAGFAVLLILLLAPYYLQWVGYVDKNIDVVVEDVMAEDVGDIVEWNSPSQQTVRPAQSTTSAIAQEKLIIINTPLYKTTVSNKGGGSLNDYYLKNYFGAWDGSDYKDSLNVSLLPVNHNGCAPCIINTASSVVLDMPFSCREVGGGELAMDETIYLTKEQQFILECTYRGGYIKTTTFTGDSFVIEHYIAQNAGDNMAGLPLAPISLVWDAGLMNTEKNLFDDISYSGSSVSYNQEIETISFIPSSVDEKMEPSNYTGAIDWAAMRTKYFILAMVPKNYNIQNVSIYSESQLITPGNIMPVYAMQLDGAPLEGDIQHMYIQSYLGPLEIDQINALETTLDRIMNFGWFVIQPFSRGILWLLKFLHSFGLNYGIILILFAFLVRIITGPLTKKSFESTQKMQSIQPELKKLQDRYKNDSQKLNTEMVKMYREHGVNPMGGCLPMLLQMPLLFSLFLVFRSTIEFRGAPFFWWIKDLSLPDTIFQLPFYVPIYGDQIAFLPILLGVSMFLTQKMSLANMDGGGMGQQKYMMYFMSVFFFLLFNSFPSGLNLYYLVYNILNYLQQKSLKKA